MSGIRITCWLAVIVLVAVSLNRAVWDISAPGAAAPAKAGGTARQDVGRTAPESAGPKLLELTVGLGGFRMPCMDCHQYLGSPPEDPAQRGGGPHKHVILQHGENNRCFNCHHPSSVRYGSFVNHDGSVIPIESVQRLCAKCHGPHYRDWKHGSHGLRTGYWNSDLGTQETVGCISCHDPHKPHFNSIPTLPGPRSLQGETPPDHRCWKRH